MADDFRLGNLRQLGRGLPKQAGRNQLLDRGLADPTGRKLGSATPGDRLLINRLGPLSLLGSLCQRGGAHEASLSFGAAVSAGGV